MPTIFLPAKDCVSRMQPVESDLRKIKTDLYFGDGLENPCMTVRLDRLEQVASTNGKLFWAVIVAILAVLGDIISNHVKF
jgi:hypothetical protein